LEASVTELNFQFITVAWGKPYVDLLVNVAIPSQMSNGNLPSFQFLKTSTYIVYTTSQDRETLNNSAAFKALSKLMSTEIRLIDNIDSQENKYSIVSQCQIRASSAVKNTETAFVWLYPDVVWPDGALVNMGRIAATGKRAILHVSLSAVTETCVPDLLQQYHRKESDTITISPRESVKLALDHMDPGVESLFWDSENFNTSPSQLFWNVPGEGVLARWFYLVPLMICPRTNVTGFTDSIDSGNYIKQTGLGPEDIYVATDSDVIFQFSLSAPLRTHSHNTSSTFKVVRWAATASTIDADNLRHRFLVHYAEVTDNWGEVERESDAVVDSIIRNLKFRIVFVALDLRRLAKRAKESLAQSTVGRAAKSLRRKRPALPRTNL